MDREHANRASNADNQSLDDREALMREQIRRLQEQRAVAMKEEIARLESDRDLFAAKYKLLEAQLQQANQEVAMSRRRLSKLQGELDKYKERAAEDQETVRSEQLHRKETEAQLKEAVTKNGTLMLKLKRMEAERDELQKTRQSPQEQTKSKRTSVGNDSDLLTNVHTALSEARDTVAAQRVELQQCMQSLEDERHQSRRLNDSNKLYASRLQDVQSQVESFREEVAGYRGWVLGKLKTVEEEMEAAKVIYSLHNSLSVEQDSIRQLQQKLETRTGQLLKLHNENRALSRELDEVRQRLP